MADLVGEIGELYEPLAEQKRIELRVRTESELIVRGDRDLLFEVVANLLDNAITSRRKGGVLMSVLQAAATTASCE
ncbi:hypothetical protein [Bradyrhizobium erythrophlei]|uniref:hypothetical protein n=1 Tax=Bradyrhizobium erythrophlei TaxID=1437360 RepID=UPI001FCE1AB4|nr:hypothetical protein [Bradyrhizobium erythrophlei]